MTGRLPLALVVFAAVAVVIVIALVVVPAGAGDQIGAMAPPSAPDADVRAGRALYETGCSSCHGVDGRGTRRGPTLVGVGAASAHFYLSTGRMPLDQPGQAERKPPAYSPEQIRQLTAYVASLGPGPEIPRVDPASGDLVHGSQLYIAHCAACHNSAGSGGALGADTFAPPLTEATPVQVAEAVRVGPGAMPLFGPETIDEHELASLLRYVEYLKDPHDRGGVPLGRVGPVPEGLVAWIVGLGLMILATFWIGTRD